MTRNSPQIPERWLDLMTGYISFTVLLAMCLALIALMTH
jgi:hypothetical protein